MWNMITTYPWQVLTSNNLFDTHLLKRFEKEMGNLGITALNGENEKEDDEEDKIPILKDGR